MNGEVEALLLKFPELKVTTSGKVQCSLSGHTMPCKLEVLQSYVKGKKFSTLKMHHGFDYDSLSPLIIPSQKRKNQLFCALTNRYINRKPDEVKGHISGRRYQKALLEYKANERSLFKEFLRKPQDKAEDGSTNEKTSPNDPQTEAHATPELEEPEPASWASDSSDEEDRADSNELSDGMELNGPSDEMELNGPCDGMELNGSSDEIEPESSVATRTREKVDSLKTAKLKRLAGRKRKILVAKVKAMKRARRGRDEAETAVCMVTAVHKHACPTSSSHAQ